jgi:hypothetical protein
VSSHRSTTPNYFGYSGFGSFNTPPSLSPGAHDPSTCVLLDLTVQIHFGSSGFGIFKLLRTRSSRSAFTRRQWIFATHPSGSDGPDSLRLFGLWEFQLLHTRSSLSSFTRRLRSVDTYPPDNQRPGSTSGLRRFRSLLDHKLPKCFASELWILHHLSLLTMDGP